MGSLPGLMGSDQRGGSLLLYANVENIFSEEIMNHMMI